MRVPAAKHAAHFVAACTRLPAKRVLPVFWRGGDGLCNTSSNFLRIGSQVGHLDRGKNLS